MDEILAVPALRDASHGRYAAPKTSTIAASTYPYGWLFHRKITPKKTTEKPVGCAKEHAYVQFWAPLNKCLTKDSQPGWYRNHHQDLPDY